MVKPFAKRAHRGGPPSPRCCAPVGSAARVYFMRNVLAHAGKSGRRVVLAFIATAFAQDTPEAASAQWRTVADQILPKVPKLAAIMDDGRTRRADLHDAGNHQPNEQDPLLSLPAVTR